MTLKPWMHIVSGFAVFNTIIGITLFFYFPSVPLTIVSPIIPQAIWAGLFLLTGIMMGYGLLTKNLRLLWYLMISGLFLKTMWEFGLLIRAFSAGTLFTAEIWGLIFYIQFLGVVYFNKGVL